MVAVTENTPYGDINIQGLAFSYPRPYAAGPRELTEGEASQLNQVLGENLRNNFAAAIKRRIEEFRKANNIAETEEIPASSLDKEELDEAFDKLCETYEFGVRAASGSPRLPADPVLKEAHKIALEKVKAAVVARGYKWDSVSKEQRESFKNQALEKYPEIMDEAKRRVESAANIAIEGLEL